MWTAYMNSAFCTVQGLLNLYSSYCVYHYFTILNMKISQHNYSIKWSIYEPAWFMEHLADGLLTQPHQNDSKHIGQFIADWNNESVCILQSSDGHVFIDRDQGLVGQWDKYQNATWFILTILSLPIHWLHILKGVYCKPVCFDT